MKDNPYAWKKYEQYLEAIAESEPRQRELEFEKLSKGWCRGSKEFRKAQFKSLEEQEAALEKAKELKLTREDLQDMKELIWEKRLKELAKDFGILINKLGPKKSDPNKVMLAALMKRRTSVSNAWLAQILEMGHPASVSQFVGRFERGGSIDVKKVDAYLSRSKV